MQYSRTSTNDHLSTTATFFSLQGGRCREVRLPEYSLILISFNFCRPGTTLHLASDSPFVPLSSANGYVKGNYVLSKSSQTLWSL